MAVAYSVVDGYYLESGTFYLSDHVVGMIHLTVSIRHDREIDTCHG